MTFEIWEEGFASNGMRGKAIKLGDADGKDFYEACDRYYFDLLRRSPFDPDGRDILRNYEPGLNNPTVGNRPYYWNCRLFDNEADARKSFG